MLGKKIGIDLGTGTVRSVVKGEAGISDEPCVVALLQTELTASAVGVAALEAAAGDTALQLRRPLRDGRVHDATALRALMQHLVTRAVGRQRIFKPDVVVAVTSSLPGDDRRLLLDATMSAGARTVYLLDAPIAAAMGAGIQLNGPAGHLVVDIGAGKTDVAVMAMEGTDSVRSLPGHGGQRLCACVAEHVRQQHGVVIDAAACDAVVESLARIGVHEERRLEVRGARQGAPCAVTLTSTELQPCLEAHLRPIAGALQEVLEEAPRALRADVRFEGGWLCGGGARLEGLDRALSAASGIEVRRDPEPQLCTVRGTGYALDNLDVLKRTFMYIR